MQPTTSKAQTPDTRQVINIENLTFQYPKQNTPVLSIPQWQLNQGERVFLFGESGSGKSTLLNLLSGTLTPTSGSITLLQQPFSGLSSRKRDRFRANHIGVVFQQFNLIGYLSVKENIQAAAWFGNHQSSTLNGQISDIIDRLQLPQSVLQQPANALSVGQQQRVAIARALINEPELLIVDEPTSALDANARDKFMALLLGCCDNSNSTLIFVSHDQSIGQHFTHQVSLSSLNQVQGATA